MSVKVQGAVPFEMKQQQPTEMTTLQDKSKESLLELALIIREATERLIQRLQG